MMKPTKPRIIAFSGPKTCGKDTLATALISQNTVHPLGEVKRYFRRAAFAEGVKRICQHTFGWSMADQGDCDWKETRLDVWPYIEPRWAMMDIADFMRNKYGADVWVNALNERIQYWEDRTPYGAYVITDLRFPNEVDWLLEQGGKIFYVERDQAELALKEAQARGDAKALNSSEIHYDYVRENAHVILDNNGTIADGRLRALEAVQEHFGHWEDWRIKE